MADPQASVAEETSGARILFVPYERLLTSYERLRPGRIAGRAEELSELPIRVVAVGERFEVIDGFRRLDNWHLAGLQRIPVVVERCGPPSAHKRMLLQANAPQRTLSAIDEGRVIESLMSEDQLTATAVAKLLGRKKEWVLRRHDLATRLSWRASAWVAERILGPTVAHHLTALKTHDQDAVLDGHMRHGLTPREMVLLIQALRIAEGTERQKLLDQPLNTVRPKTEPRRTELEQRLEQISRALADLGDVTLPQDLCPGEHRRLEALHRRVCGEIIRLAHRLETRSSPFVATVNLQYRSNTHDNYLGKATEQGDSPGRPASDHRPGLARQRTGNRQAPSAFTQDRSASAGGGEPAAPKEATHETLRLYPGDRRAGQEGPDDDPDPQRNPGTGLSGQPHDSWRSHPSPAGPDAAGGSTQDPVPF